MPPPACLAALGHLGFHDPDGALANLRRLAETPDLRNQVAALLPRLLHHLGVSRRSRHGAQQPRAPRGGRARPARPLSPARRPPRSHPDPDDARRDEPVPGRRPDPLAPDGALAPRSQRDANAIPRGDARRGGRRLPPVPDRRGAAQRASAGEAPRALPDRPPRPARGRGSRDDDPGAVGAGRRVSGAGPRDGGAGSPRTVRATDARRPGRRADAHRLRGDRARQARGGRAQLLVGHRPLLRLRGRGRDGRTGDRVEPDVLRAPGRAAGRGADRDDGGGHRLPGRPAAPARGDRRPAGAAARRLPQLPRDARGPLGAPGADQGARWPPGTSGSGRRSSTWRARSSTAPGSSARRSGRSGR